MNVDSNRTIGAEQMEEKANPVGTNFGVPSPKRERFCMAGLVFTAQHDTSICMQWITPHGRDYPLHCSTESRVLCGSGEEKGSRRSFTQEQKYVKGVMAHNMTCLEV
ncbi:hypothetical protein N7G274_007053 [Stereocaulon virgatum]|uniref:Uncharacterized protein n=1 Tax=Stereocaulon virgatum TaxID=373712 RepID=A0ABR4A3Y7_9LECA